MSQEEQDKLLSESIPVIPVRVEATLAAAWVCPSCQAGGRVETLDLIGALMSGSVITFKCKGCAAVVEVSMARLKIAKTRLGMRDRYGRAKIVRI
jgi:hypothetical protein